MAKFITYEKMSKKQKAEINKQRRGSWNGVNPVTKVVKSKKQYNRKMKHKNTQFDGFLN